jgi:colanic acid biosynthesis glycosyl transferase WcaI
VVPPDDPEAFVAAVRDMVADPVSLARQGAAGRAWVEQHASPQAVAAAYVELIRSLRRR